MKDKLYIFVLILILGCGKNSGESPSQTRKAKRSLASCTIASFQNEFNVDSCLKEACLESDGKLTKDGCKCPQGEVFNGSIAPGCYEVQDYADTINNSQVITRVLQVRDNYLATKILDNTGDNFYQEVNLPFFLYPNVFELYLENTDSEISKKLLLQLFQVPYIYTKSHFGEIEKTLSLQFNTQKILNSEAPFYSIYERVMSKKFIYTKTNFATEKGCLEYCKKIAIYSLEGFDVERVKTYFGGLIYSDEINIFDKGKNVITAKINIIDRFVLLRDKISATRTEFSVLSFDLKSVTRKSVRLVKDIELEKRILRKTAKGNGGVVLCDSGILPSKASKSLSVRLIKGPSKSSFYGWISNASDQQESLSGLFYLNKNGAISTSGYSHAEFVMRKMGNVNIAPISVNNCIKHFDKWSSNALNRGIKTISYAYTDQVDQVSCFKNSSYTNIIQNKNEKKFLWIFSGGNSKKSVTPDNSHMCPQNILANKDNVIIVGAENRYGSASNRGRSFIDIFTHTKSTSEAAGFLSAFVSTIFELYPNLTTKQVRLAVLVGAEDKGLPSRSRGYLHKENALKAAKILSNNPNISLRELNEKIHCDGLWGCKKRELNRLTKRLQ